MSTKNFQKKYQSQNDVVIQGELARRELSRRRLLYFTQQTVLDYKAGWVHDDICRRLERFSAQVSARESPRLMLLVPPRHGKSELASIRFPAWHLGHNPRHEIVNVGYNLDLPMKFSRTVRDLLRDKFYQSMFPETRLNQESQSVESWLTTAGGGFTAVGVGGGLTGKGAHILTIDDPIKNLEEADSIVVRDNLYDWFQTVAYTRLAPGGGVLLIETWWNDDDLAGRLQALMRGGDPHADQYEVVRYPALAEAYEYRCKTSLEIRRTDQADLTNSDDFELLRSPGEPLHEDRYDREALLGYKANMAIRHWSALYQQNPTPDEGAFFKKEYFQYVPKLPLLDEDVRRIYTAWDFAIGVKQTNDYTVGVTIVQDAEDNLYVVDVQRFKGDAYDIVNRMLDVAAIWGSNVTHAYRLGVEDTQIWKALRPLFQRRCQEMKTYPMAEELKPLTDKMARARPLQGRMQHKKVWFPQEAQWLADTTQELLRFPAGAHDDIVDAMAWCVQMTTRHAPPRQPLVPAKKSWKDRLKLLPGVGTTHMSA